MSSRQITIIANWKANLPPSEEVALAKEIAEGVGGALQATGSPSSLRVLLAPSALGLVPVASLLRREYPQAGIEVAAQDTSLNSAGAFTGEIPADHFVGIAPVVIGLFFLFGIQLMFIGILGEYIASIHTYVQRRPVVVEKERINF